MANFNSIFGSLNPIDYTFDNTKIDYQVGMNPKLKELPLFSGLGLYIRTNNNANDYSNLAIATTATNITYASGLIEQKAMFNGVSSLITIADFVESGVLSVGFSFWIQRVSSLNNDRFFTYSTASKFMGFWATNDTTLQITFVGHNFTVSGLVLTNLNHIVVNINESGISEIFVNGISKGTDSTPAISSLAPFSIQLGVGRDLVNGWFNGSIEQFIYRNSNFTAQEISDLYNAGAGKFITKYDVTNPTLKINIPLTDNQLVNFDTYSIAKSGTGSIGVRLSKDNYATSEYWNGTAWDSTGTSYNSASTVNTNISSFSALAQQISTQIAFVSDGFQPVELSVENIGYSLNTAPTINAGANKPIGGQLAITDTSSFNPYSDASFSDIDGSVTKIFTFYNATARVEILQGAYATLKDAVLAYSFNASTIGKGTHTFTLVAQDNLGAESQDSLTVTIVDSDSQKITDIHDAILGKERSISVLGVETIKRADNTILATYNTYDENNVQTNLNIVKVIKQ